MPYGTELFEKKVWSLPLLAKGIQPQEISSLQNTEVLSNLPRPSVIVRTLPSLASQTKMRQSHCLLMAAYAHYMPQLSLGAPALHLEKPVTHS